MTDQTKVELTKRTITTREFLQAFHEERTHLLDQDAIILMPASFWTAYQTAQENYKKGIDQMFEEIAGIIGSTSNKKNEDQAY
jgi:hypothetical protein